MGKIARALSSGLVLLLGLAGCELALNVGGLTERSGDDAVAGDATTESPADGESAETDADAAGEEADAGLVDVAEDAPLAPPTDSSPLPMRDGPVADTNGTPDDAGTESTNAPGADGGTDAAHSVSSTDGSPTDGPVADSSSPPASYASCLAILQAASTSVSGTYHIAPGGTPLEVHCDMAFGGGGWTLVLSTNGGTCSPATATAGSVALDSCAYVPSGALTALAKVSTTVHVRSASGDAAPADYVTSVTAVPIQNLRMGLVTNANEALGDAAVQEAAWTVVGNPGNAAAQHLKPPSILAFTCSVAGEMWPSVYHACGNSTDGFALDVTDKTSVWNWSLRQTNVPIEVYVR